MAEWFADVQVQLHDEGAAELHAMAGTEPAYSTGAISVRVTADDAREALLQALDEAARFIRSVRG